MCRHVISPLRFDCTWCDTKVKAGSRITVSWLHAVDCLWRRILRRALEKFGHLDENRLKASGLNRKLTGQDEFHNFCTARADDSWTANIGNKFKGALLCQRENLVKNMDHGLTSGQRDCKDQMSRCTKTGRRTLFGYQGVQISCL